MRSSKQECAACAKSIDLRRPKGCPFLSRTPIYLSNPSSTMVDAPSRPSRKGKERETPLEGLFPHLHLPSAIKHSHSPLAAADEEDEDRKEFGNGWREFKKGKFTSVYSVCSQY